MPSSNYITDELRHVATGPDKYNLDNLINLFLEWSRFLVSHRMLLAIALNYNDDVSYRI